MSSFSEYYSGFEKMQEFIISDLKNATIKGHANFLVAMALFNYIEILGGFCYPCDIKEKEIKRFNFVFTDLLPVEYKKVFENIRDRIATPYSILRCGMTHGYLPSTFVKNNQNININYSIKGIKNLAEYDQCIKDKQCGVDLIEKNKNEYLISVYNPRFIYDLLSAFEKLKQKINNEDDYKAKFVIRASNINIDRLV